MISTFVKECEKNVAGNSELLFIAAVKDLELGQIATELVDEGANIEDLEVSYMQTGKKFAAVRVDLDSVEIIEETESTTRKSKSTTLEYSISKKSFGDKATLGGAMKHLAEIENAAQHGLAVIRKDKTGKYLLSGILNTGFAIGSDDSKSKNLVLANSHGYRKVNVNFTSGKTPEDWEEGNRIIIQLESMAPVEEILILDADDSIKGGTNPAIDWPS